VRSQLDADVAGEGGGYPQQPDQRAGRRQADRNPAGLARRDLRPEAVGDQARVAELPDRRQRRLLVRQAGAAVCVGSVQESGTQLGDDPSPGPHRTG
jgi:hypothetical protein